MRKELLFYESEIAELTRILSEIPKANVIDRMSFEYRLQQAQLKLSRVKDSLPDIMTVTFRGKPVHNIHGIDAVFAGKFADIISKIFAAFVAVAKGIPLGSGGAIPEFAKHKLLITGTAVGSFGFELELPKSDEIDPQHSLIPQEDPIQKARVILENVLEQTFDGNDDQLAESIESVDQRALDQVNDFYELLRDEEATFALKTKTRQFSYPSNEKIQYAVGRLKKENIIESSVIEHGYFKGFLPTGRTFEFYTTDNRLLKGKVAKDAEGSEQINRILDQLVTVSFATRTVGRGTPRYTLRSMNDITPNEESNG